MEPNSVCFERFFGFENFANKMFPKKMGIDINLSTLELGKKSVTLSPVSSRSQSRDTLSPIPNEKL